MIDTGIGPTQINALLSSLNIPTPSENLYKRPSSSTPVQSLGNLGVDDNSIVDLAASYDMGWQMHGNGISFDSLTGDPKSGHDWRMNFSGSSKAMEANVAMELVNSKKFMESGVQIGVFIGDDDSAIKKVSWQFHCEMVRYQPCKERAGEFAL
ncbi:hypothetical protein J437_LFUL005284 [Ladona fulva]|uniref:Mutator-like transposase domain-containing protein n=1 Tax=Ladona fulva TaxID=123851 RepID=A0A8K0K602_LADFU|nr:hypothetical protein J437_LFUL005284 [Ladona fulva]